MSHFDLDAWQKSTEAPTVTIAGKTYTGRLLSYQEFLPFIKRVSEMQKGNEGFAQLAEDYLTLVFPPKKYVTWKPTIVSQLMALPNLGEVLTSFLALQTQAMGISNQNAS